MKLKKLLTVFLSTALLVGVGMFSLGCPGSSSTGPGGGGGTGSQFITIQTPFGPFTFPTLGVSNLKGLLLTTPEDGGTALALFFGSSTSQLIYAGDVSVNSNTLDTINFSGQVLYGMSPLSGVNFDGSAHSWTVAGGSGIPAFSGSVNSPNGTPTITSPTGGAIVPRNQDLTITWTGTGSDSAFITVGDAQGLELNWLHQHRSFQSNTCQRRWKYLFHRVGNGCRNWGDPKLAVRSQFTETAVSC